MISFAMMDDDGIVTQVGAVANDEALASLEAAGLWIVRNPPAEIATGRWQHFAGGFYPVDEPEEDAAEVLANIRASASLDKSTLLIRMMEAGILPPADAEIAAGGEIPPIIQSVLDGLPPEVFPPEAYTIARIKWRSDNIISRVNPVIVLAGAALGVSDEGMDAIFGVNV